VKKKTHTIFTPTKISNDLTSRIKSLWVEFLNRSISLLNLDSFTSNLPNSFNTEDGSDPTSSRNTRPNNSTHKRQRPKREFAEVPLEKNVLVVTGVVDSKALSGRATDEVEGSMEGLLSVAITRREYHYISLVTHLKFGSNPKF